MDLREEIAKAVGRLYAPEDQADAALECVEKWLRKKAEASINPTIPTMFTFGSYADMMNLADELAAARGGK